MDYSDPQRTAKYHKGKTRMQEDRHGLLLDTGAIVNVHSDLWRKRYEQVLTKRNIKIKETRKIATFSGINGKPCVSKTQCHIPINVAAQSATSNLKSSVTTNALPSWDLMERKLVR